jgi:23S rRNA pseudouridine1911/1915/1917 synthase
MDNLLEFIVDEDYENVRVDKFLSELNSDYSRSYIQKLIKDGRVKVNGKTEKPGLKLSEGDRVELDLPDPEPLDVLPEDIPLDIIYEDNDIIIINKPKGRVVHPAPGHLSGTLVNALLFHCKEGLSGINGVMRPGIVHRIDKDTTGLLVVCKNDAAHRNIAEQLKVHSGKRIYYALVHGIFKEKEGRIENYIARSNGDRKKMAVMPEGKRAVTNYKVIEEFKGRYSLVECRLETGRTHQIRVHMAYLSHPLVGDTVYSGYDDSRLTVSGQVLHAAVLGFVHPSTGEYVEFSSELPEYFEQLLESLR